MKVVLGIVALTFMFVPQASADQVQVTGQTNTAFCAQYGLTCIPVMFTATLNLQPEPDPFSGVNDGSFELVTSLTGTLDHQYTLAGTGGDIFVGGLCSACSGGFLPFPNGPQFTADGMHWKLQFDDVGTHQVSLENITLGTYTWVTWNAQIVRTPEPSTFMLLILGIAALAGLHGRRRSPLRQLCRLARTKLCALLRSRPRTDLKDISNDSW